MPTRRTAKIHPRISSADFLSPAQKLEPSFSNYDLVAKMCDRTEPDLSNPYKKILEPSCGTGNFLAEILRRRLSRIGHREDLILIALSNIYGIDIRPERAAISRDLMRDIIYDNAKKSRSHDYRFWSLVDTILERNIIAGDFLDRNNLTFIEWTPKNPFEFSAQPHSLAELLSGSY